MAEIVAHFTNAGVPLTTPTTAPTVTVHRIDTGAAVVTAQAMTEIGSGSYAYTFAEDPTLEYTVTADGDPLAAGQVTETERYVFGSLSGIEIERIESDIPAILADTDFALDATVSSRSSHSAADVDTVLTGTHGSGTWQQGNTVPPPSTADIADAVWDEALAGHVAAGSAGEAQGRVDVDVSTRSSHSAGDVDTTLTAAHGSGSWQQGNTATPPTAAAIADAVWDEPLAGHGGAGSTGEAQSFVDVAVSSRSDHDPAAVDTTLTGTHGSGSWQQGNTVAPPSAADIADAVWDELLAGHAIAGSAGAKLADLETGILAAIGALNDLSQADVQSAMTAQGYTTVRAALLDNLGPILVGVEKVRKVETNRVVVNGSDTQVDVYEDNGTTIAFSFTLSGDRRTRTPV